MTGIDASGYELLLDDMVFEVNELLTASRDASSERRLALVEVAAIIRNKIIAFDVDPSIFRQPLLDLDRLLVKGS